MTGTDWSAGLKVLAVISSSSMLAGCGALHQRLENPARVDPVTVATYSPPITPREAERKRTAAAGTDGATGQDICYTTQGLADLHYGAINLDCFSFPEDRQGFFNERVVPPTLAYARAAADRGDRNRLTSIMLKHSDDVCTTEMGRVSAIDAITSSSLSIFSTAFSTAASIISGEKAKSILAGGATFFGSTRDHLKAEVYRNQLTQALSLAITSERTTLRKELEANYTKELPDWNIDDAVRAVNHYHQQCSFYRGLELLTAAANEKERLGDIEREQDNQRQIEALGEEIDRLEASMALPVNKDDAALKALRDKLRQRRADLVAGENLSPAP